MVKGRLPFGLIVFRCNGYSCFVTQASRKGDAVKKKLVAGLVFLHSLPSSPTPFYISHGEGGGKGSTVGGDKERKRGAADVTFFTLHF